MTEGWFPKIETDGWTGLALVNTETSDAAVVLTAYDENGGTVAVSTLPAVKPGQKIIGLMAQLFSNADLSRARYFGFVSDKTLIGFSVSQSEDGLKLDGLMTLSRYLHPIAEPVR